MPKVVDILGSNESSVRDLIRNKMLPQPILIGRPGGRACGFISDEIEAFINARIESRNAELRKSGIPIDDQSHDQQ
jgi:predicted DNA-binding transcriptional regulator AlpA